MVMLVNAGEVRFSFSGFVNESETLLRLKNKINQNTNKKLTPKKPQPPLHLLSFEVSTQANVDVAGYLLFYRTDT